MDIRQKYARWTNEALLDLARSCASCTELRRRYPSAYVLLYRRGLRRQCRLAKKRADKYTTQKLDALAMGFKTRGEWQRAHPSSYKASLLSGNHDARCQHMAPVTNPFNGGLSVYTFTFGHAAYVGVTCNVAKRLAGHLARGPVFEQLRVESATFTVVEDSLNPTAALEAENAWISRLKRQGFAVLNRAKGHSLGSIAHKHSKDAVFASARKFQFRGDWYAGAPGAYLTAKYRGWFAEAAAHMPKNKLSWLCRPS